MRPITTEYPVFESNQVLTATHLNNMQNYLDEQNRLTRSALYGIGVVCGLDVGFTKTTGTSPATLTITPGFGVTSEGFTAILGERDFVADRYRVFTVEDGYPLLSSARKNKYELWELLDANHDDYGKGLPLTDNVPDKKIVLLYVELLQHDLKNCSATSCDDMGMKIAVNIRKLLIKESDMVTLHEEIAADTKAEQSVGDFVPDLASRFRLPDIALPRIDVPASNMVDGPSIFDAYRKILSPGLSRNSPFLTIGTALDDCYKAFSPILPALRWKFSDKLHKISALYEKYLSETNVIFSQYFHDFLADLINAYDEFRWKATEFTALCNPPRTLFPRHLELGDTRNSSGPIKYRHYFRPSPALATGKPSGEAVRQLFLRLRLMVEQFKVPSLPVIGTPDTAIKITPSRSGDIPLSHRSIPAYYASSKALPEAWNIGETKWERKAEVLGYHVDGSEKALVSDLERYNFFRIEGHLGFDWRKSIQCLLGKIRTYRLPFDVIALNAHPAALSAKAYGADSAAVCLTSNLEVIYEAWKSELECLMREKIKKLTDFNFRKETDPFAGIGRTASVGPVAEIRKVSRKFDVESSVVTTEGSFGRILIDSMKSSSGKSALKLQDTFKKSLLKDNPDLASLPVKEYDIAIGLRLDTLTSMFELADALPDSTEKLDYMSIKQKYDNMTNTLEKYRDDLKEYKPSTENPLITDNQKEEMLDELENLLKSCLMERLGYLDEELDRRREELEKLFLFGRYALKHPGMAHKAGVPPGGTFVLVYHEASTKALPGRLKGGQSSYMIPERVVIADFFLPYRCCSDCPPVQFFIPAARPVFSMKQQCPNDAGIALVDLDFTYRIPPCEVRIDGAEYLPLMEDRISLAVGRHLVTVRDAEGGVSLEQSIEVRSGFSVEAETPVCDERKESYTVKLKIANAKLPVTVNGETVETNKEAPNIVTFTVGPCKSSKSLTVRIGDSSDCPEKEITFSHTCCDLPCKGMTLRRGYRFPLPAPAPNLALEVDFRIEFPQGKQLLLSEEAKEIILSGVDVAKKMNALIDRKTGIPGWFSLRGTRAAVLVEDLKAWEIDCFDCLEKKFSLELSWTNRITARLASTVSVSVNPSGSTVKTSSGDNDMKPVSIPAFGGLMIDRCHPETPPGSLCDETDLKIAVKAKTEGKTVTLSASPSGSENAATYLWEVPGSVEKIANGQNASFTFTQTGDEKSPYRVTAFTEKGCSVSMDGSFSFDGR